jgi:hypothetical protein
VGIIDSIGALVTSGIGGAVGSLAKDIRTAITGKEAITSEERQKILDNVSEMEKLALSADLSIAEGQMKINEIEAASGSLFKGGWRPAVGWVCVMGIFYQFIIKSTLPWALEIALRIFHVTFAVPVMPSLDMGTLMVLLTGLLGLGGMRTFEKLKGVD